LFLANKDAVLKCSAASTRTFSALTKAIRKGDGDALFEHFTRTRAIRKGIVQIGQDSASPDLAVRTRTYRTSRCRSLTRRKRT